MLSLKKLSPTRLIKNAFFQAVDEAENRGASADELRELLGRGRAKKGMFEGDLENGELEIGQIASLFDHIQPVADIMQELEDGYRAVLTRCRSGELDW